MFRDSAASIEVQDSGGEVFCRRSHIDFHWFSGIACSFLKRGTVGASCFLEDKARSMVKRLLAITCAAWTDFNSIQYLGSRKRRRERARARERERERKGRPQLFCDDFCSRSHVVVTTK